MKMYGYIADNKFYSPELNKFDPSKSEPYIYLYEKEQEGDMTLVTKSIFYKNEITVITEDNKLEYAEYLI